MANPIIQNELNIYITVYSFTLFIFVFKPIPGDPDVYFSHDNK